MNRLVLFDIDETLLDISRGHISAFSEAFKKVYGIETSINIIRHPGMTDQQIILEVLKKNGLDKSTIKSGLKECVKVMIDSFNKSIGNEKIVVLDGVYELLKGLNKNNVLMGLVTGNLEPIARGKLKKVSLNHYFKVGGFGSDDMNRTNLVKLAIKRAGEDFGFKFNDNVFIFGDTPRDVKAGKEANIKTIGVTTGSYSKEQLEAAGADFILENLKDIDKILEIIL
ncbi:HAD hydrolase-like protein [Candidatus Woesearchaeota archaeon]|nr:HAD hydrolase-like protein [Candidatus Woesearchaeota archaeon]